MMEWTDRHCRSFHRVLTRRAKLYTEMVSTGALIHGPRPRLLAYDEAEHPVALQLGGSDPKDLALCARMAEEAGFDEVNLNVGCPSESVQRGAFGACLMREPALVGDCVAAMRAAVRVPVTVKCRIGVDDESEDALARFVEVVARAGCDTFVVHARKAWLKGLSPKENREVPPLNYALVYALKRARPDLTIVINGGVASLEETNEHLAHVDGVMMGRTAYQSPWTLAQVDDAIFGEAPLALTRHEVVEAYLPYISRELARGTPLNAMTRHILGLFNGCAHARTWRRLLAENAAKPRAGLEVVRLALSYIDSTAERAAA
jgi:tRNA-dihydrouridine synthase A